MINEEAIKVAPFQGIKWADVRPAMESPLESFVAHNLPVYVRVNSPHEVVLCTRRVQIGGSVAADPLPAPETAGVVFHRHVDGERLALPAGARSLLEEDAPALTRLWESDRNSDRVLETVGFDSAIQFLRVPEEDLRRMALYGEVTISFFNAGGLEEVRGGKERLGMLRRSAITRAGLVRQAMMGITGRYERPRNADALYDVAEQRTFKAADLYVIESEFQAMLVRHAQQSMPVAFPFSWGEQCQGVVWLYEAAYVHGHLDLIEEDQIAGWLRQHAPEPLSEKHSWKALQKWAKPTIDRSRGRKKNRKVIPFNIDGIDDLERFKPDFVNEGLALILFYADKWFEMTAMGAPPTQLQLAKWLVQQGFDDTETVLLVHLITGSELSDGDTGQVTSAYEWIKPE